MPTKFEREIGEKWYQRSGERGQVHTDTHGNSSLNEGTRQGFQFILTLNSICILFKVLKKMGKLDVETHRGKAGTEGERVALGDSPLRVPGMGVHQALYPEYPWSSVPWCGRTPTRSAGPTEAAEQSCPVQAQVDSWGDPRQPLRPLRDSSPTSCQGARCPWASCLDPAVPSPHSPVTDIQGHILSSCPVPARSLCG